MINHDIIMNTIQEFAIKYNFIQQIDIQKVEEAEIFHENDYWNLRGKKFVSIHEYSSSKTEIVFGKIYIEIDRYNEEEFYSIEKDILFVLNINDFLTIEVLIEKMISKCTLHKLI